MNQVVTTRVGIVAIKVWLSVEKIQIRPRSWKRSCFDRIRLGQTCQNRSSLSHQIVDTVPSGY